MNILIPIGDKGEKFLEFGYETPKPLINVLGKPMIFWLLDNLVFKSDDRLFIVYNPALDQYLFQSSIKERYEHLPVSFVPLSGSTCGAAETVLFGLEKFPPELLDRPTICLDCDTFYNCDVLGLYRAVLDQNRSGERGHAVVCFEPALNDPPLYSYIECSENKEQVLRIEEKVKISNLANTGCYCFASGAVLKQYASAVMTIVRDGARSPTNLSRAYISSILNMILAERQAPIFPIQVSSKDFVCLGTPLQIKAFCSTRVSVEKKRFCFDLDKTLVTAPMVKGDYSTVRPIESTIKFCRMLKNMGHDIIIQTARRMKTHHGNVGKVIADIGMVTIQSLKDFGIPYDEIYFGKPFADFYIDDLAVNPLRGSMEQSTGYYDLVMPERTFNELKFEIDRVIKTSSNSAKLMGEIYYYKNIPEDLKHLFPALLSADSSAHNPSYTIERVYGPTMANLLVNKQVTSDLLSKLLVTFSDKFHKHPYPEKEADIDIYENYLKKFEKREIEFDFGQFEGSVELLRRVKDFLREYETERRGRVGIIHGDPVFSNILVTGNAQFKMVDMRGVVGDKVSICGDILYDYAKIYQSLLGYESIQLGRSLDVFYLQQLQRVFKAHIVAVYGKDVLDDVLKITSSLLITLIPLQSEHKEKLPDFFKLARQVMDSVSP